MELLEIFCKPDLDLERETDSLRYLEQETERTVQSNLAFDNDELPTLLNM